MVSPTVRSDASRGRVFYAADEQRAAPAAAEAGAFAAGDVLRRPDSIIDADLCYGHCSAEPGEDPDNQDGGAVLSLAVEAPTSPRFIWFSSIRFGRSPLLAPLHQTPTILTLDSLGFLLLRGNAKDPKWLPIAANRLRSFDCSFRLINDASKSLRERKLFRLQNENNGG